LGRILVVRVMLEEVLLSLNSGVISAILDSICESSILLVLLVLSTYVYKSPTISYVSILNYFRQYYPRTMPSKLHPKKSKSNWSHQHSSKLGRICLVIISKISHVKDIIIVSLKSRMIIIFTNSPSTWATTNTSSAS